MLDGRKQYLIKNTIIFTLGSFASKFITFFLVPLYTNVLTTAEYGTIDFVATLCTVMAPILMLNIGESVMRFSLDKDANQTQILSIGIIVIIFAIIVSILVFPISKKNINLAKYSIYIYMYIVSIIVNQVFLCYLRGKELLVQYSIANVLQTLFVSCLNIIFLLKFKMGIQGYFLSFIISYFCIAIYCFFVSKMWKDIRLFCIDKVLFLDMIKYSVVLIPNTFMWWIMNSSDRIMVSSMVGMAANGVYAISYKLPTFVTSTNQVFTQAWGYSAIKEKDAVDECEYNNEIFKTLISFVMLIGVCLLSFGKPFLKLYVSATYYDAWKYMPFLTMGCVYLTLGTFMATSYSVHKDSFGFLISALIGAMINILLNFVLIPRFKIYGAAIATCISYIVVFVFRLIHTRKYLHYNIRNKEFIVGSMILILELIFVYLEGFLISIIQVTLCIGICCFYSKHWIPILKSFINK